MSSPDAQTPQSEADLSMEEFVSRGNARDRGEDIPLIEEGEGSGAADANPDAATAGVETSAPHAGSADKPIDKRTREGRKLTIQQEIDELTTTKHSTAKEIESARAELQRLRDQLAHVGGNVNRN